MKKLLSVALTLALLCAADSASAQLLRNGAGIGSGIGSRLTDRARASQGLEQGEAVLDSAAIDATQTDVPAQTTAPAASATSDSAQQSAKAPIKKSDGSEFKIPAGATPDQLIEKANELMSTEVAFETEEEYDAWVSKMLETVGKIGDGILKANPTDEQFVQAISLKGQALCYQASIDPSALQKLGAYATALEKNAKVQGIPEGKQAALAFKGVYLQAKVAEIAENNGTVAQLTAIMKEISAFIAEHPETSDMTVDLVFPVALVAENQKQPKLPAQIWTPIRKQLAASDAPEAKAALQLLEGTIRYSELEGNEFEWKGCMADGTKLDEKLVAGHVVLVDFWASWSEACADVHTQLKQLYAKYHDQGFEVVGYNLDGQAEDMEAYLEKNNLPWLIMSDRATVDKKETSLAAYYGISEIPTMILIGGDGKVAALDISMESLVATLESVFAKPAKDSASSAPSAPKTGTAGTKTTGTASSSSKTTGASTKSSGTTVSPARKSNAPTTISSKGASTSRKK